MPALPTVRRALWAILGGPLPPSPSARRAAPTPLLIKARPTPAAPTAPPPTYAYGSTQCAMPPDLTCDLRAFARGIPEEHLGLDGREDDPHVTVKYGLLQTDAAAARKLRALCRTLPPLEIRLGKTSLFPAREGSTQDVVKIDVESGALRALNKRIAALLPCVDTHPVYRPHVTVAYVQRGLGERYTGNRTFEGRRVLLTALVLSTQHGEQRSFPFLGKAPDYPGSTSLATLSLAPHHGDRAQETLSKGQIRRPGSHGAMLWHYDASGNVAYGPMEPQAPPARLPVQQAPPQASAPAASSSPEQGAAPQAETASAPAPLVPPAASAGVSLPTPTVPDAGAGPADTPPPAPAENAPPGAGAPRAHDPGPGGEQPTLRSVRETDRALRTLLHMVPPSALPPELHALLSFPQGTAVPGPLSLESGALLERVRLTEAQVRDWRATALFALSCARHEPPRPRGGHVAPALVQASERGAWPEPTTPPPPDGETGAGACICGPWWQQTLRSLMTLPA